jgi:predicted O-methyltransferase YrrM
MSARSRLSRQYNRIRRSLDFFRHESGLPNYAPRGHFYSPLPDLSEGSSIAVDAFARPVNDGLPSVDLRVDAQKELLLRMMDLYSDFDWSENQVPGRRFHFNQRWYRQADSICLYSMLRIFRPRRVVEVGSGFSSALILDVNDIYLGQGTSLTVIEPYPDRLVSLLTVNDKGRVKIICQPVQNTSIEVFSDLESGDFLFIDSSHISRVGSDVNFLVFEVLPQIPVGTVVHFHDIFWPFEYPAEWIGQGTAWNESYLLHAFLMCNTNFEIVLWVPFCARMWPELIKERMPNYMNDTGAAIWVRRVR